jgi:RHS repeat-associated protein
LNRLIHQVNDPDGESGGETVTNSSYVYDGNQIIEVFEKSGGGLIMPVNLRHRELWGPAIDQLLADEVTQYQVINYQYYLISDSVHWALTDNLNSVRDLAVYEDGTTTILVHRVFDAFGVLKAQVETTNHTAISIDCHFYYTGKLYDSVTHLQNNINRWYEPTTGKWISKDPICFQAGDQNLYRYVGNQVLKYLDPHGLWGTDFHIDLTYELAIKAGFSKECARKIAKAANGPDDDPNRDPVRVGKMDAIYTVLEVLCGGTVYILTEMITRKEEALTISQKWHFPMDPGSDTVVPNSKAANEIVRNALANGSKCAIEDFGEGLHVLQDSWSHQGKPSYKGKIGHSRGMKIVEEGHYEWNIINLSFWWGIKGFDWPRYVVTKRTWEKLTWPEYIFHQGRGYADDMDVWREEVRAAALRTYEYLLEFRKIATGICKPEREAEPLAEVKRWLETNPKYAGMDPQPGDPV